MSSSVRRSTYVFEYRISFMGADKVGKSALINQIVEKKFAEIYRPTISNHITHVVEYEGQLCVCLLVDTAGCEDFPAMRKLAVSKGNAFVVVYAIDNRSSFDRAKRIIKEIKLLKASCEEIRIVLVGNKNEGPRVVSFNEGFACSANIHEGNVISTFVESNAKEFDSAVEIMYKILKMFSPPITEIEEYKECKRRHGVSMFINRRSSKSLVNRKLSRTISETTSENENYDSMFGSLSPKLFIRNLRRRSSVMNRSNENNTKIVCETLSDTDITKPMPSNSSEKSYRDRSKSTPNIKGTESSGRPSPTAFARKVSFFNSFRRGSLSPTYNSTKIGSPKLLTQSMTLNRRLNIKKNISPIDKSVSLSSLSSDDSGMSEGSLKDNMRIDPTTPSRTVSLPIGVKTYPRERKRSLSNRFRDIFKRQNNRTDYNDLFIDENKLGS